MREGHCLSVQFWVRVPWSGIVLLAITRLLPAWWPAYLRLRQRSLSSRTQNTNAPHSHAPDGHFKPRPLHLISPGFVQ